MHYSVQHKTPDIPGFLRRSLRAVPDVIHHHVFVNALNRFFNRELNSGQLDFLQQRNISLSVDDVGLRFSFVLDRRRFRLTSALRDRDFSIAGKSYDYLQLLSTSEDPDTLFFSRRIKLNGDTELGLHIKNFLDGMDMSGIRKRLLEQLQKLARLAVRHRA